MPEVISILMPMRNAEAYVRDALASLLGQRGATLEVIVVDDGSTDRSADIVRGMNDARVKLVPGPRRGIAAALNAGLAATTGDLLGRCDADDLYPDDRLAWQRQVLADRPDVGAVCGTFEMIAASGKRILEQRWGERAESISGELRRGVGRTHFGAFLTRTAIVRQLGGFREYFVVGEDSDLVLRIGEACDVWYEPRVAYRYRLHGESITHTKPSSLRAFFDRTMLEFQRQRLASGADDLMRGAPPAVPTNLSAAPERPGDQVRHLLVGAAWRHHAAGRRGAAIRDGVRAAWRRPLDVGGWRSVAALALKPAPARADAKSTASSDASASGARQPGGA